ncbi:MAG: response regulator [Bacteroidetes bacterium]|nr:response regulator [Bacteroidota bacterium]
MSTSLHVLLIEDNEYDAELIIRQLTKAEYLVDFEHIQTENELIDALERRPWDVIICDYSMPRFSAPDALRVLQQTRLDIPFIVISGTIGEETAVEVMRMGAQDYLMKENLTRLGMTIKRELADAQVRRKQYEGEKALFESETKFRTIFEKSIDAIGISLGGIQVLVNSAFLKLFGYTNHDELTGLPVINLIAPAEREKVSEYLRQRPSNPDLPSDYETRGFRKDGTEFEMEVRVSLFDLDGNLYSLVIIHDITERKQVETELITAKEKAEEADKLKSNLMMNMSHEFRTPMNAILGFSSIIVSECVEEKIRNMADKILISGDRLMKTLNDILSLTQLQSGYEILKPEEINLTSEITGIIQRWEPAGGKKKLRLEFQADQEITAIIDEKLFNKAMDEIIGNAVKFTEYGGITIWLSIDGEIDNQYVRVHIKDTGIGISSDNHHLIFESFRQVSAGYSRRYEGSGLGLTLAKKIIGLMKGEILLESELGKGSEFIIRLPLSFQPDSEKSVTHVGKEGVRKTAVITKKDTMPSLLLVEDSEDNIIVTEEYLCGLFNMDSARNGLEALMMCEQKVYDVILMDINLGPGMDGLEVVHEILKIAGFHDVPIVALTGYTFEEDKERILEGGCSHHLGKPFTRDELLRLLETLVQTKD